MANPPKRHTIKVFEHDPRRPTVPGQNPLPVAELTIEHQATIPRREREAIKAVQAKTNKTADIKHTPSGDMTAIILVESVQDAAPSGREESLLSDAAMAEMLRSPVIRRELARIARDPRVSEALKK